MGVNFADPAYVRNIYGKNDQLCKSYICLFTCAATRYVHLELRPSIDASNVIKVLARFLSRRGCIKMFISDNFSRFESDEVSKFLLLHNIDWTVKTTLRKISGRSKLNFKELYTMLTQVQCMLNSRPLSYVSQKKIANQ